MTLFDYAWIPNFFDKIKELKDMAMEEEWDYRKHPSGKEPILVNYIKHTFIKLYEEGKIYVQNNYSVFQHRFSNSTTRRNICIITKKQKRIKTKMVFHWLEKTK